MKFKLIIFLYSFLSILNISCTDIDQASDFILKGDIEWVLQFLKAGNDINSVINQHGSTLLHLAAANGKTNIVEILIREGAKVDSINQNGWNPLHHAALSGNTDVIKLLLEKKANPNLINNEGDSSLHILVRQYPKIETVNLLLDHGADPRVTNFKGIKPEYYAKDQAIKDLLKKAEQGLNEKEAEKKKNESAAAASSAPGSSAQDKGEKKDV